MRKRKTGGPPSGELKHFTNRDKELSLLRTYAEAPADTILPVLMFYGVGGIGKSWLLRRLQGAAGEAGLPTARLDFDPQSGGIGYHGDSAASLSEIRRQLDVPCPRFDLAYAMMLHQQGIREEPRHRHAGQASTAWELAGELTNAAVSSIPGGNVLVWLGKKVGEAGAARFRTTPLGRWLESRAGNDDLLTLRGMTYQEIYPLLPERLAADLEEHLPRRAGKQCRAILFLDTFEALRVGGMGGSGQYYAREEWVGRFYECLESVLLVLAGRDRLTWDETDAGWQNPEYLRQELVGGLSRPDAVRFLGHCRVTAGRLQDAILAACVDVETPGTGTETAYHPFSLGLCADTVLLDREQGREPAPESFRMAPGDIDALAARFLRSFPPYHERWVVDLSLTPRFDAAAAKASYGRTVGGEVHAAWDTLQEFSFLRAADTPGFQTLHPRMQEALRARAARNPEGECAAHTAWREYWSARAASKTDGCASLAWYHTWHLDPDMALAEWYRLAEGARGRLEMALHYELLDWWDPTGIESRVLTDERSAAALNDIGIEYCEASQGSRIQNVRQAIACYAAALRVRTEAALPRAWAMTQNNLGIAYRNLPNGDRGANLRQAIACYAAALQVYTEAALPQAWAMTQNNLGIAYLYLPDGDRSANLRRAIACYAAALQVYTKAALPQEWAMTQNNLGIAYQSLVDGNRGANLRQAIACYEAALRVRTEAALPQGWADTRFNQGLAYSELGEREAARAAFADAVRGYRKVGLEADARNAEAALAALENEAESGSGTPGADGEASS